MKSLARSLAQSVSSVLMVLLLLSCNGESPTSPSLQPGPVPPANSGSVWGFAHDQTGVCVGGAVVEMLDGPRAGDKVTQADRCGSVWDYDGGYSFKDLPANTRVRVRASKKGYVPVEMTFATTGWTQSQNLLLVAE